MKSAEIYENIWSIQKKAVLLHAFSRVALCVYAEKQIKIIIY